MLLKRKHILVALLLVLIMSSLCEARRRRKTSKSSQRLRSKVASNKLSKIKQQKQLLYQTRETNTPNFVRLVVMRLIYGIATQMGVEDRLDSFLGGAFAPPNADSDYFGFGGGGEGEGFSLGDLVGFGDDDY